MTKSDPVCFLDMDGVLSDFVTQMSVAHNRANPYIGAEIPQTYHMEEIWGISREEFWEPANSVGFWSEIPQTPEKESVLSLVFDQFGQENVYILTSPSLSPMATAGKVMWIQKNIPELARQFFVGPKKEAMAHPGAFLIDDHDENIKRFKAAGGDGSVFPRPWNSAGFGRQGWGAYVQEDIESYLHGLRSNQPKVRTGDPRFHRILEEIADLHDLKQQDYGSDEDSFANYRSEQRWGVPAWQNAMMRVDEKMNRLGSYASKGNLANEGVIDSLRDGAVGFIIGEVLLREEKGWDLE